MLFVGRFVVLSVIMTSTSAFADDNCDMTIKLFGMLSRAQFSCTFLQFNQSLIERYKTCNQKMEKGRASALIKEGMRTYDQMSIGNGYVNMCNQVAADFPTFIKR